MSHPPSVPGANLLPNEDQSATGHSEQVPVKPLLETSATSVSKLPNSLVTGVHDSAAALLVDKNISPLEGGENAGDAALDSVVDAAVSSGSNAAQETSTPATEAHEGESKSKKRAGGAVKKFLDDEGGWFDWTATKNWFASSGRWVRDGTVNKVRSAANTTRNLFYGDLPKWHALTEKGIPRQSANIAKFTGTGGVSYGATTLLPSYLGEGLRENLVYSNLTGFVGGGLAVPGVGPVLIVGKRLYASRRKAAKGNELFKKTIDAEITDSTENRRFFDDYNRELSADQENLIDEDGEEELLQAFHHSNFAGPHTTPYLGSRRNYARHCMLNMLALCGYAAGKLKGQKLLESLLDDRVKNDPGLRQEWLNSIEDRIARLSPAERDEILAKHNIFDANLSPEEQRHRLKAIRQTSIAYGRLLEKYHSDRRESQITGSIYGPSVYASYATASPVPLIGAGLVHIGRRGYRAIVGRKSMVNLEFDEHDPVNGDLHGRDGGPIIPASLARKRGGAGIYQHAVLVACIGKTQADLTEPQKYWYKHINLHASRPRYASTRWKKPEDLAQYCAAAVQKDFASIKHPKPTTDNDKLRDAKEEARYCTDKLKAAKNELKAHDEMVLQKEDTLSIQNKNLLKYQQLPTTQANTDRLNSIDDQIFNLERELQRLQAPAVRLALESAVIEWEGKEKDAKEEDKKLQDAGKNLKEIGLDEAGRNLDIQRAFAVKIQEEFAAMQTGRWKFAGAIGHGAKAVATSGPVKTFAKDVGEIALATGFFSGAAYGAAAYAGTVSAPMAGVLVGGIVLTAKVYQKLKKWTIG